MTYEEIKEKLQNLYFIYNKPIVILLAILELHKPIDITLPNGEWGTGCKDCDNWDYPCLTVQAIEKELK